MGSTSGKMEQFFRVTLKMDCVTVREHGRAMAIATKDSTSMTKNAVLVASNGGMAIRTKVSILMT